MLNVFKFRQVATQLTTTCAHFGPPSIFTNVRLTLHIIVGQARAQQLSVSMSPRPLFEYMEFKIQTFLYICCAVGTRSQSRPVPLWRQHVRFCVFYVYEAFVFLQTACPVRIGERHADCATSPQNRKDTLVFVVWKRFILFQEQFGPISFSIAYLVSGSI